jgi:Glycosyltransferase sugar-binding region containing DXD motif
VKEALLAAARALDRGKQDEALDCLMAVQLTRSDQPQRLVAISLWKRVLAHCANSANAARQVSVANEHAGAALERAYIGDAYQALPIIEAQFGAAIAAAVVAATLWDRVLAAEPYLFKAVFELFYRAGGAHCVGAYEQFLAEQRGYSPGYWDFVLLSKCLVEGGSPDLAALAVQIVSNSGRDDLVPLFDIYLMQMRQAPVSDIVVAACALPSPAQRRLIAENMVHMGYTLDELRVVVASMPKLVGDRVMGEPMMSLMRARLANAEDRWQDALNFADVAGADSQYRRAADLVRALALARSTKTQAAIAVLDDLVAARETDVFQRARASFIRVTTELVARGLPVPEDKPFKAWLAPIGRPLAQSLWVGPKLRWIERLSIKSYLDNGWRFQLYVYDEPQGVPEGCEILDAAAIIPAADVFREGQGSGSHAGSLGAFSDLFRYALLGKRGGMWTDTDVINFRRFDPDGQKFICAEITDAGLVTLNGAIMAAEAGDPFVTRAYDRARELLASGKDMFFTRIGPYLLAEVALELGVDTIEIMPPGFLSPISWMNAASLLQPFETLMARQEFRDAVNVHVYTEMWRTLGLGLDVPPGSETFLGRLYADHFGGTEWAGERLSVCQ